MTPSVMTQITALRKLRAAQEQMNRAAAAYHDAVSRCLSVGCTQSQMAIETDVSRQAMHEYVQRWFSKGKAKSNPRQGTLL